MQASENQSVVSGERRFRRLTAKYQVALERVPEARTPQAWRVLRGGYASEIVARLVEARERIAGGEGFLSVVHDGTLGGWELRLYLSALCGQPIDMWCRARGRTLLERQALIERALGELGQPVVQSLPAGGVR